MTKAACRGDKEPVAYSARPSGGNKGGKQPAFKEKSRRCTVCRSQARLAAVLRQSKVAGSLSAVRAWWRQQQRGVQTRAWATTRGCLTMTAVANNPYAMATADVTTRHMCQDEGSHTPVQVAPVRRSQQEDARRGSRAAAASRRISVGNNNKNNGVNGLDLGVDNGVSCARIRERDD